MLLGNTLLEGEEDMEIEEKGEVKRHTVFIRMDATTIINFKSGEA